MPTYGDEYTVYHCHMISVVVFFNSNTLKSMLVDCAVIEMGCFDNYLDADTRSKTMRGNDITTFLLHISQFITFRQAKFVRATLISEE